jgi:hypothetical protein
MPYVILRGLWRDIIVLDTHSPTEDKWDDSKDRFDKELEGIFYLFPIFNVTISFGDSNTKERRRDTSELTMWN